MAQPAYDVLSEKRQLESAGFAPEQAEAIVETVMRTMTANQQMSRKLDGVQDTVTGLKSGLTEVKNDISGLKSDMAEVKSDITGLKNDMAEVKGDITSLKIDLAEVKNNISGIKSRVSEMATSKDLDAAVAVLRADMYRALWVQGLSLGTLILGLAVVVATAAVF